jgi:parallel beta-helix repeat protein
MHLRRRLEIRLAVMLTCAFLAATSTSVSAATTHWVNDDSPKQRPHAPPGRSCNRPGYPTIQSAVDAAAPGDRINVCPGTYMEEVTIPPGKDDLQLRSVHFWAAVIKAPPVMLGPTKSIVRVNGARGAAILAFTITGPGGEACDSLRSGVRIDDGGSADIFGNHITHIHDTPFSSCQNGIAVAVGGENEVTVGSARILGNAIDTYQRSGPRVSNEGSFAEIAHNRILGVGPTAVRPQNGVVVIGGATATVRHNFVAGNLFDVPDSGLVSTGILLFQSGQVLVDHNTLSSNDNGVGMFEPAPGSATTHNRVRASTFDGIALSPATGHRVAFNKVDENNGPGISVSFSQGNALQSNLVERNRQSGVLLDGAEGNEVDGNRVRRNGTESDDTTDGIRLTAFSTSNTLRNNHLKANVTHDCHDDSAGPGTAGTANFWIDNRGQTSQPQGLCAAEDQDGDDDRDDDGRDDGDDRDDSWRTSNAAGWDAWSASYFDSLPTGAADTATLLQLAPRVSVGAGRRSFSPED